MCLAVRGVVHIAASVRNGEVTVLDPMVSVNGAIGEMGVEKLAVEDRRGQETSARSRTFFRPSASVESESSSLVLGCFSLYSESCVNEHTRFMPVESPLSLVTVTMWALEH